MTESSRVLRAMILVKATPVLTRALEESMCVAAMTLEEGPQWIRLHPVPFRDLEDETRFKKYQEITVTVSRSSTDRRPESWLPHEGSISLGEVLGTEHSWSARRQRVEQLGESTMCELQAANSGGHGAGIPSLAVVRARETPKLIISHRDDDQVRTWQERAKVSAAQASLFDDPAKQKVPLEIVPWRFQYGYQCLSDACNGHEQTIIDWEIVSLWRKVKHRTDWQEAMSHKFVDEVWASNRDTRIFVGNQAQRPKGFLILGVFWPPTNPLQPGLLE